MQPTPRPAFTSVQTEHVDTPSSALSYAHRLRKQYFDTIQLPHANHSLFHSTHHNPKPTTVILSFFLPACDSPKNPSHPHRGPNLHQHSDWLPRPRDQHTLLLRLPCMHRIHFWALKGIKMPKRRLILVEPQGLRCAY